MWVLYFFDIPIGIIFFILFLSIPLFMYLGFSIYVWEFC